MRYRLWWLTHIADKRQIAEESRKCSRTCTANKTTSQACKLVLNQGDSIWFPQSLAFDFASFSTIPFSRLAFCFAWSPYLSYWPAQYFSIVPPPDSCCKAPNSHLSLLTRSVWHRSWAQGMPAELDLHLGLPPGSPFPLIISPIYRYQPLWSGLKCYPQHPSV